MGNTENADQKQEIMTGKEYRSIFWRSFTIQSSWAFVRKPTCFLLFIRIMD